MPDGTYRAAFGGYKLGFSSAGNEQIGILFELLDEPHKGRELVWYGSFSEAAFPITWRSLRALGWQGTAIATFAEDVKIGHVASLVVESEEFDGKRRNRIIFINRAGGIPMRDQMNPAQRQAFAKKVQAMIDGKIHERKAPGAPPLDDDAIPF